MENNKRVGLIDEIRGFAILCMVVYHLCFDLQYMCGVDVPIMFDGWFNAVRDVFAGMFIFISGTACRYSRNNLKRGVQCFFLGMLLTFVTAFVSGSPILFGILHCLGVCMMIFGLFEKIIECIPTLVGFIVCAVIFAFTMWVPFGSVGIEGFISTELPEQAYSVGVLFPLGFPSDRFSSLDYFPLLPWLFLFLAGAFCGVWFKENRMPAFMYRTHVPFLALVGRYTLWVYIIHQPIIYVILALIFNKPLF